MMEPSLKSSTDLWFCAFLRKKGYKIISYDILARGKGRFHFSIEEGLWKELKLEFNNSELSEIKQNIEMLKDLCF